MQDRNCKADGRSQEKEREGERRKERKTERERASLSRSDAIFTPIYGEIPGRGTLTTSKQDLWKTPGDLRYHYFPCGMSAGPTLPYRGYLDTFHKENLYTVFILMILKFSSNRSLRLNIHSKYTRKKKNLKET